MEGLADESKVKAGAADEPEAKAGEEASFPLEVVAANENSVAVPDTEGAGLAFTAEIAAETPLAVEPTQTAGTAASMGKPVAAVVAAQIAVEGVTADDAVITAPPAATATPSVRIAAGLEEVRNRALHWASVSWGLVVA
jgi:hypothetical protein